MRRKIIKQGVSTLTVSLPSDWAKTLGLAAGSEVELETVGNEIVVSLPKPARKQETTISLTGNAESAIRTIITNTYRSGYDRITVQYQNDAQFRTLSDVIKTRLIGFDVTQRQKGQCVVENVTEPTDEKFDVIIQKLLLNISELFQATKGLRTSDSREVEDIEERIQKYDNFCRRVIAKGHHPHAKPAFLWTFLALIVHAQREIYHLSKALPAKTSKSAIALHDGARQMFELLREAHQQKSVNPLVKMHDLEKRYIYKEGYAALEHAKGKEAILIYHLLASIRQFYLANSPLAGLLV